MSRTLRPITTVFLALLSVTAVMWILRGLGILSFLPSGILWILIFFTMGAGVSNALQWTKR
jgi:hypothetical protein